MKDEGVTRLRSKAESGEPLAQLLLGRLYWDGPLLTPDWVEAQYWFEQSAQNLPDAQYALGKLLLTNDPEIHDRELGLHWLTQAAESGHDYAAYRLGKELLKDGKVDEGLIFQNNAQAMDSARSQHTDHKLRRKIQEKKIAMGHKPDDHEEQRYVGPTM